MKTDILGVSVDVLNMEEAKRRVTEFVGEGRAHSVFTPNPEFVMAARKDTEFRDILNQGDLVIPDGIGLVYASRLNDIKLEDRVPGYDLIQELFAEYQNGGATFFFWGAAPGVTELAKRQMEEQYPGLQILGTADGYFTNEQEKLIINEINEKQPDILLFGSNFIKQEKWISTHLDLPVKVIIGCGGSFDVMSGKVKRAPESFRRLRLEWLYRLISQPSRIKRQIQLPLFMLTVIANHIKGGKTKKL